MTGSRTTGRMTPIRYSGRIAALAIDRVHFAPHIDVLEPDHPTRRFVGAMALVARAVDERQCDGPYEDGEAERLVRAGLMPADLFGVLEARPDWWLAEMFGAPLEQVRKRREELQSAGWLPGSSRKKQ